MLISSTITRSAAAVASSDVRLYRDNAVAVRHRA